MCNLLLIFFCSEICMVGISSKTSIKLGKIAAQNPDYLFCNDYVIAGKIASCF